MSQWHCRTCDRQYLDASGGDLCPVDGSVLVSAETSREYANARWLGRAISGRYLIFGILGVGGFGAVYRAHDSIQARDVAIKIILPSADVIGADVKGRFRQEAQLLESLESRRIIEVYEISEFEGTLYMVLELFPGRSLDSLLGDTGTLKLARAIHITSQILDGLAIAHRRGLIHRDLKPSNILVDELKDDEVKLIDFGIAKVIGARQEDSPKTGTGLVLGTVRYMAPEQLKRDGLISPQTDLYSVGILFYEMVVGHTPYDGSPAEMAAAQLYSPAPTLPRKVTTPELDNWFGRVMTKEPSERFVDALTMQADLIHSVFDETTTEKRADYLSFAKTRGLLGLLPVPSDGELSRAKSGLLEEPFIDTETELPPETSRLNVSQVASLVSSPTPEESRSDAVRDSSDEEYDEDGFTEQMNIADISLAQLAHYHPVDVSSHTDSASSVDVDAPMPATEILPTASRSLAPVEEVSEEDILFDESLKADLISEPDVPQSSRRPMQEEHSALDPEDEMTMRMGPGVLAAVLTAKTTPAIDRVSAHLEGPVPEAVPLLEAEVAPDEVPTGSLASVGGPLVGVLPEQGSVMEPAGTGRSKSRLSWYTKGVLALILAAVIGAMVYQGIRSKNQSTPNPPANQTAMLDAKGMVTEIQRSVSKCECARARRLLRGLLGKGLVPADGELSQLVSACKSPQFGRCEGASSQ